ncbi:uncharacterized protein LOC133949695 [Platichthys flesus]|uniref:uncharacterized protein LOC133949695 n=1 Tax=Platichthys flesus TaxID=8260 RepID=UPI002DBE0A77|nr:uncharacterized protein LOC133949695 [Platichthys flesus]
MKSFNVLVILLLVSQHALCVEVSEGAESVLLPCLHGVSQMDGVLWLSSSSSTVHARKQSGDDLGQQDPRYQNRTSMREDAPQSGNLSLTLSRPSVSDTDNYTCIARSKGQDLNRSVVLLIVTRPVETESSSVWWKVLVPLGAALAIGLALFLWCKRRRDRQGRHESHNLEQLSTSVLKVEVESGAESVQLPFRTTADLSEEDKVEWMRGGDMKVHVYQNISDQPGEQHEDYRGRTHMSEDPLGTGDLSLTLEHPTVTDSNTYTCTISRDGRVLGRQQVELKVKVLKVEVESGAESVQLPFITPADLSEKDKVEWMGGGDMKVHVYQNISDQPGEQDKDYRGRTHMSEDPLRTRDLSLTLEHPTVRDNHTFTCTISRDGRVLGRKQVELKVKDQTVEVESGAESVQLPFRTTADLPENSSLRWLIDEPFKKVHYFCIDNDVPEEQHEDYRGRTQMSEDPLGTGDLSLTLRHPTGTDRNTYTCRVFNQDQQFLREKTVRLEVKDRILVEDETINNRRSSSTDPTPLMADQSHQ